MEDLIEEMVEVMAYDWDTEEERESLAKEIEVWLLDDNDDGSPVEQLVERFEAQRPG